MSYDSKIIKKVLKLSREGFSSRKIAEKLGIKSKSTVNDIINRNGARVLSPENREGAKILLFDLETAPSITYTFGRCNQNISQDAVHTEGGWIICAGYKWLGSGKTEVLFDRDGIKNKDDSKVVAQLWELFEQADAVVAHNLNSFDIKILRSRCAVNSFPDLPSVKQIDTLVMAKKKFRFNSNKLDSLGKILLGDRKVQHSGILLWVDVLNGCEVALQNMVDYCRQDVDLLEGVYYKLRSFGLTGSNFNQANYYEDKEARCGTCGSDDLTFTGRSVYTAVSEFAEVRCNSCGTVSRTRQNKTDKEKRSVILQGV